MSVSNRDLDAVLRFLAASVRRVRRISLLRGAALVGIVWILSLAAVMSVDARLVIFDDRLRWAMSAGVWTLVLVTALLAVVRPLCRRIGFRQMAGILDARHAEHEERLSSIVELSDQLRDPSAAHGFSLSLYARLCELAGKDVVRLDLRREFPLLAALLRVLLFVALAVGMAVGIASSPHLLGRLFIRAVAPWADVGNLYANDIVVTPGDAVVLSGTVVGIRATVDKSLPATPTIRISRRRGLGWTEEIPEAMSNGLYCTTADDAEPEWRYRVNAGPAMTRYYRVRVSKRPAYDRFTATVTYPDYTGFRSVVFSNEQVSAIRAIEGSRVDFDLTVSEPGTVADFRIGGEPLFGHTMVSNRTSVWSLELVNSDGFRSSIGRHALKSVPDQPPTLVIESPSAKMPPVPPHAKVAIDFTASDDVKVLRPRLRYAVDDDEMRDFGDVDEFGRVGGRLWRGKVELDLSTLDLRKAKKVSLGLFAWDNCPAEFGGPHSATSAVVEVTLAQPGQAVASDVQQSAKEAAALLDEAKKRLQAAARLTDALKGEIAAANRRNEKVSEQSERKTEAAAHEIREAKKRLEELAERFDDDSRFEPLEDPVSQVAEDKVQPVLETVAASPFQERAERQETMANASGELREAEAAVDRLARMVRERTSRVEVFEKAKDVAARQEELARAAADLREDHPDDAAKLEAWKRLEADLARQTAELARAQPRSEFAAAQRQMETAIRKADQRRQAMLSKKPFEGEEDVQAAEKASEILEREIDSQARALDLSKKKPSKGGVASEMEKLEGELHRNESPDYFRKLFRRLGWFRIRGSFEEGVPEQDLADVPTEYRDLVRRYFLKLAEESGK